MSYLRNIWYLAAWGDEVATGGILARTFLDERVVLFRDSAGRVNALADRCPHRFAPLSKGRVAGDSISCGYHGLAFNGLGSCTANPHGPITGRMSVKAYPIRETHRGIWIWMGDPARVDETTMPPLGFVDDTPDTAFSKGYIFGRGNYQLFVDNILDLTHADYLHPTTLGGGAFTRTIAKVVERPDKVSIVWDAKNETPSPLARATFNADVRVDSWTEVDWYAPSVMTLYTGSVPTGTSRVGARTVRNLHVMTPETSQTTHYFFASTRNFAQEDADLNQRLANTRNEIFSTEDKPMIDAQQERMGGVDFWELRPLLLRIDDGPVRARRRLEKLISQENWSTQQNEEARHSDDT